MGFFICITKDRLRKNSKTVARGVIEGEMDGLGMKGKCDDDVCGMQGMKLKKRGRGWKRENRVRLEM